MGKNILKSLMFTAAIFFIFPLLSQAKSSFNNDDDVFQFVQAAFLAQVSLSEKERSLSEINEILAPYFTEYARDKFLEENLFEENGRYFTLGTDFPIYYIPFFSYEGKTEVLWMDKQIYVFEYFPKNDGGPVSYDSHYEGVFLEKEGERWKVAEFLYDIPPEELKMQSEDLVEPLVPRTSERLSASIIYGKSSFCIGCFKQPVTDFYRYGYSILTSFSKYL